MKLSEYRKKVNSGKIDEIAEEFKESCPICGGGNCAKYNGYYTRQVVDEGGTYHKNYRIIRFKCNKKGKKCNKHLTFSMLPSGLIPYVKYSVGFILKSLSEIIREGKSIKEVLNNLTLSGNSELLTISPGEIYQFKKYVNTGINRLTAVRYDGIEIYLNKAVSVIERISCFLKYLSGETDGKIRSLEKLSYDFYENQGGYKTNSMFLLGIPSQFRPV